MKISFLRKKADLLVLPIWEGGKEAFSDNSSWKKKLSSPLKGFKGSQGETEFSYWEGELEPRALLLGLGAADKVSLESIRRAFAAACKVARSKKLKTVSFVFPTISSLSRKETLRAFFDGIFLSNYSFTYATASPISLIEEAVFIGVEKKEAALLSIFETIASSVFFVRDLVNANADEITPQRIAAAAIALAKKSPQLTATVFDRKKLEAEKMGLLLAVGRGASVDPCLVQLSYKGNPSSKEHIVLVGKGITFDTGGLSIKTAEGMVTMKCDMAGAATVLSAVQTAAALKLKVNVTALAPCAENAVDAKSYKPGDVYTSYSGKTVEINNTDAEGRLVLADAIAYAVKALKPSCVIDLATLTGAIVIALGEEMAGFFTQSELLSKQLLDASASSGDMLWRMPMHTDYKDALKSDIADIIHTGGRDASSIKAALFLQEFAGNVPFVHIDIAGPAFLTKPKHYHPTKATGFGLRLLIDFLESRA
ncbi:MAG TPA: leucyl aminopeptidase [Chlamydiales bacterium]